MRRKTRSVVGAVGWIAALLIVGCGGEPAPPEDGPTAENPLVLGSPLVRVVSGQDTFEVYAPTVFVFVDVGTGEAEPLSGTLEMARGMVETVQAATTVFGPMGVRVTQVGEVPVVMDLAPGVEEAAGPPLGAGGMGYLLVHPRGVIRRLDRTTSTTGLVCAARALFALEPPAEIARACGAGS